MVDQRHLAGKEENAATVRTAHKKGFRVACPHKNAAFVRRQTLLDRYQTRNRR